MNMDPSERLKVAVIGSGHIGPRHATSVVNCNDTELLCFVDPSRNAQAVADSFQVPLFESIESMLAGRHTPDAAIVCTPNSTHVDVAKQLLAAGIHVLVEKPISTTVASGRELVAASKQSGKHLLVGHHRRFNPYIVATKRALEDGAIGKVVAVSGVWAAYKPPGYFEAPAEWRRATGSGKLQYWGENKKSPS